MPHLAYHFFLTAVKILVTMTYAAVELKFLFSWEWPHRVSPDLKEGRGEGIQIYGCCLSASI